MSNLSISFHGGSTGTSINNILAVTPPATFVPLLTPNAQGVMPALSELRGFFLDGGDLYVVNAFKDFSNILKFVPSGSVYAFDSVFASGSKDGLAHPFCAVPGGDGHIYVSNQDVQQGATSSAITFYEGPTMSHPGKFKGIFIDGFITLRGIATNGTDWYVADEGDALHPGSVSVYDSSGKLKGTPVPINQPVHLLYDGSQFLYIGSEADDTVYQWDPSSTAAPAKFIITSSAAPIDHTSGLCLSGTSLFVGSRKSFSVNQYPIADPSQGNVFISGLADNPEFVQFLGS